MCNVCTHVTKYRHAILTDKNNFNAKCLVRAPFKGHEICIASIIAARCRWCLWCPKHLTAFHTPLRNDSYIAVETCSWLVKFPQQWHTDSHNQVRHIPHTVLHLWWWWGSRPCLLSPGQTPLTIPLYPPSPSAEEVGWLEIRHWIRLEFYIKLNYGLSSHLSVLFFHLGLEVDENRTLLGARVNGPHTLLESAWLR